ncbi:heterokaryon incompatibility protein-domain-containing protein [Suillus subluteus]|nr:heterokaryon incompatibility protein-domain-containing protein [Suillus subluteus]
MLSKLENAPDTQKKLREQYVNPSEAEGAIQEAIKAQLDDAPHRLFTFTGRLCDREVQIDAFKTSTEYKELLSSTLVHVNLPMQRIQDVVAMYFRYVMLSHRWEGKEPMLYNIQGKVVYDLDPVGGIAKLQSFCQTARDMGYRWTWIDTCCIDQTNNVEVQQSVNSMFIWYRHSALTIIYLSDVSPSSQPGALACSAWNTRGWTVQESIMQEMGHMRDAWEKLQWVSARVTTWPEDIAYSLFGIFGVKLIYGEKKQNALGRLLQEVVAQSGNISALDWVGQSSEFNSCLAADITSYKAPPYTLPSLSEDDMQTSISSLRHISVSLQYFDFDLDVELDFDVLILTLSLTLGNLERRSRIWCVALALSSYTSILTHHRQCILLRPSNFRTAQYFSHGGRVTLIGESGAGKSTFLYLLYRFYDLQPDSGCILIDGQGIRATMLSSLHRAIGVVPQGPVLFNANIGYNIGYGQPSITPPDESTIISSEKLDHLNDVACQSVDPPDAPPIQASYVVPTGRPGRPRIEIEPSILASAIALHGPTHLAAVFQVSARTMRRCALEYGLVEPGAPVYVDYEAEDGTVTRFYTSSTAPTNS